MPTHKHERKLEKKNLFNEEIFCLTPHLSGLILQELAPCKCRLPGFTGPDPSTSLDKENNILLLR
jgi:hypothetical protein